MNLLTKFFPGTAVVMTITVTKQQVILALQSYTDIWAFVRVSALLI